jgi:hypothetical protein
MTGFSLQTTTNIKLELLWEHIERVAISYKATAFL